MELKFEMELLIFLVGGNLKGLGYYAPSLCVFFFSQSWNMPEVHLMACQPEKKMKILS